MRFSAAMDRLIPAKRPGMGYDLRKGYDRRWASMTLERIGAGKVELVSERACVDTPAYSTRYGQHVETAATEEILERLEIFQRHCARREL